jgi:hypothetical protein
MCAEQWRDTRENKVGFETRIGEISTAIQRLFDKVRKQDLGTLCPMQECDHSEDELTAVGRLRSGEKSIAVPTTAS